MNPELILNKYFSGDVYAMMVSHGSMVAGLAVDIGRVLGLPSNAIQFLWEAGMLHDVGVSRVYMPDLGLLGKQPYMAHGVLGRQILEEEGLSLHALICERHIGVGLTAADIVNQRLPLPARDMTPQNVIEEIVCFADLFYSKKNGSITRAKSIDAVRRKLSGFGETKVQIFDAWVAKFKGVF